MVGRRISGGSVKVGKQWGPKKKVVLQMWNCEEWVLELPVDYVSGRGSK